jgi:hypothetical protein
VRYQRRSERGEAILWLIGGFVAVVLAVLFIGFPVYTVASYKHVQHMTCTVTDKDRAANNNGGSDMRVYTKECGNLVVADATFRKNFHASDTYAGIKVGRTYRVETIGFRIPFLSEFPNIMEAREVPKA